MNKDEMNLDVLQAEFEEARQKYIELGKQVREAQLAGLNAALAAKKAAEEAVRAEVNKLGQQYGYFWTRFGS